ncbi:MAG: helix-turn-helix domain-containing protein [Candidatus Hodarchaeales archaeon]|jgi:uncharacterized membrane protein
MKSFYLETSSKVEHSKKTLLPQDMSSLDSNVLSILKQQGPITRGQLVKKTGIPRSTLYDSLFRLILKGLVRKYPDKSHTARGRPQVYFEAKA